jgi:SAM-dependent methyltransferase
VSLDALDRQPHAALDLDSRLAKAEKIARLVRLVRPLAGARILDIGAGSGQIASSLAAAAGANGEVWAVDTHDQRRTTEGYEFKLVTDTQLPFRDGFFDVVVSNHVIEHVGDRADQMNHLAEIRRVLRPDGVVYLAVPNRWVVIEPHFRLPLLSWLPDRWRTAYIRVTRRGDRYDCNIPTRRVAIGLFGSASLDHSEVTIAALRAMTDVERPSLPVRLISRVPERLLGLLLPAIPTMVFLLRKKNTASLPGSPQPASQNPSAAMESNKDLR